MNRKDVIELMASQAEITRAAATRAFDAYVNALTTTLKKGEPVAIAGLGTMSVTKRAARTGRNPATGDSVKVPARKVVRFKAATALAHAVDPAAAKRAAEKKAAKAGDGAKAAAPAKKAAAKKAPAKKASGK